MCRVTTEQNLNSVLEWKVQKYIYTVISMTINQENYLLEFNQKMVCSYSHSFESIEDSKMVSGGDRGRESFLYSFCIIKMIFFFPIE